MKKVDIELMFPRRDCSFNPAIDIQAVSSSDVVDIKDAFVNGLIPDNVVATDADFDNNDNPRSIIGRPANEFDAIHMAATIKQVQAEASASE